MLVDAPNSEMQPVSPEVVAAPPHVKLSTRQTFQAALVVRLLQHLLRPFRLL